MLTQTISFFKSIRPSPVFFLDVNFQNWAWNSVIGPATCPDYCAFHKANQRGRAASSQEPLAGGEDKEVQI